MSRNFRIFQIFLKNRRIARKHSDTSRTIDRKDRKSGKKRAIRERRVTAAEAKETSKRAFFSFFSPRGRDCLPDCLHNLQHALWLGYSGKFAELRVCRDCRRWQRAYHLFQTVFTTGLSGLNKRMVNDRESFRENEFCPVISLVLWWLWWTFLKWNENSSVDRLKRLFFEFFVYFDRDGYATNRII